MARNNTKEQPAPENNSILTARLKEGVLIIAMIVALFLLLAFTSFHISDAGWTSTGSGEPVANITGRVGAWLANVFLFALGYPAYLIPFMLIFAAWKGVFKRNTEFNSMLFALKTVGFLLVILSLSAFFQVVLPRVHADLPLTSGGVIGELIGGSMVRVMNITGSSLVLLAVFVVGSLMFTGMSWFTFLEFLGRGAVYLFKHFSRLCYRGVHLLVTKLKDRRQQQVQAQSNVVPIISAKTEERNTSKSFRKLKPIKKDKPVVKDSVIKSAVTSATSKVIIGERAKRVNTTSFGKRQDIKGLPSLDLLNTPTHDEDEGFSKEALQDMSLKVETCLSHFGVEVKVVAIQPGPVVTRFELELAAGVKVSKISTLAKDIARTLSVKSVRIVEIIAGKSVIGLEVPNAHRETVFLREVVQSKKYQQSHSPLTLTLGKDISGHPVTVDLAKMPHMLVAGTTGSGKSVAVNAMILSMLYKSPPDQVRFIMIDPKMLELSIYEGIPHLLTPVVTDMKEAANALRWSVAEMDRRYRLMANLGVRNLAGYNDKIKAANEAKQPIADPFIKAAPGEDTVYLEQLPSIVVIIDEFADMMMIVGKKVEELIARIAQKARAAGIHLLLATQRPSVDVITGIIKANIPTRIAFQVSSRIDSRTILDQQGAEQLLGMGDMLYLPPGSGLPVRVHGAFVSDNEVHQVVEDWKKRGEPHYIESILDDRNDDGSVSSDEDVEEMDELYDKAVAIVLESNRPSISYVQRRLKIGYNRSARLLEAMERAGVVSSMDQGGSREVLVQNN